MNKKQQIIIFQHEDLKEKWGTIDFSVERDNKNNIVAKILGKPDMIPSEGILFIGNHNNHDEEGFLVKYKLPNIKVEILPQLDEMERQMGLKRLEWDKIDDTQYIKITLQISLQCKKEKIDIYKMYDDELCLYSCNALIIEN